MVQITGVIVALILFLMLLLVGILILSGIVPGFNQIIGNASCALGSCP